MKFLLGEETRGIKFGFSWFIVSEVIFFFSFFWAFFSFSVIPASQIRRFWPSMGIEVINWRAIPLLNTVILLSSGVTLTIRHSTWKGKNNLGIIGLIITIGLGIYFILIQFNEYSERRFTIADGIFGSSFYVLTGLHSLHVILGVIFLRRALSRIKSIRSSRFEISIWYWHFVDVVWLFLFGFVYVWRS